jgi:hypothetical protein
MGGKSPQTTDNALSHLRTTQSSSAFHLLETGGQLRILLRDFKLRSCGFSVRQGIDNLSFRPREFGGTFEVLEGLCHLALLEKQLCHGSNSDVAFGVDYSLLLVMGNEERQRTLTNERLFA